ncbi:MAG: hypothetical protein AAF431_04780 [Pseudomonadota bacterium]
MKKILRYFVIASAMFFANFAFADQQEVRRCFNSIPEEAQGADYLLYFVRSNGAISDGTFITMSKRKGASGMSKDLAKVLYKGRKENQSYIICGPNSKKSLQVLADAFRYSIKKKRIFPKLDVTYIGSNVDTSEIESNAKELQIKIVSYPLNEKDL